MSALCVVPGEVGDCVGGLCIALLWKECVGSWYLAEHGICAPGSRLNGPGVTGSF